MKVSVGSSVRVNVYGSERTVSVDARRPDGSYQARVRVGEQGNSVRGILRSTKQGLRFKATNPQYL